MDRPGGRSLRCRRRSGDTACLLELTGFHKQVIATGRLAKGLDLYEPRRRLNVSWRATITGVLRTGALPLSPVA